jgi:putative acyl-CoA dehydrogenase
LAVPRAAAKDPEGLEAFIAECELAAGGNALLDEHLSSLRRPAAEWEARRLVEDLALALEASQLVRHAPPAVADAFCASRLGERRAVFGNLPAAAAAEDIVERALP